METHTAIWMSYEPTEEKEKKDISGVHAKRKPD